MDWTIEQLSILAGALITIISFAKLVVTPFNNAMKENKIAMDELRKTIDMINFDVKDSQKDRENIHKIVDRHETRISHAEDNIIVNNERIKTLFERGGK